MIKDSIGNRMKENYEDRQRHYLTRRTPVIIRVDGVAFHTLTRGFDRPFDGDFCTAMLYAADHVLRSMQGFKIGYVQSDEASFLLTDYDKLTTEAWFDRRIVGVRPAPQIHIANSLMIDPGAVQVSSPQAVVGAVSVSRISRVRM